MSVHLYPMFTILVFCVLSSKTPAQSNFYLDVLSYHKFQFQIPPLPPGESTVRFFVAFGEQISERDCCIMSPLHIVLFHEDITQLDKKKTALGIHVI